LRQRNGDFDKTGLSGAVLSGSAAIFIILRLLKGFGSNLLGECQP
jgi:hypothetical protein